MEIVLKDYIYTLRARFIALICSLELHMFHK